jgi:leader peptidase (prepilin peptidase)/N-methyltransferase
MYNELMHSIVAIFIFAFGAIIGSFLNVVILRRGTGRGLGGRSKCAVTGKPLQWFELIPILSFLIQRGRTRHGGARISWQYPLVEFFTGVGFVAIAHKFFPLLYIRPESFILNILFYFVVYGFFVLIFVYDWKHQIIPNDFVYPLMILGLIALFYGNPTLMGFLAGPILAFPILAIWFLTHGRGMGFGDVKLLVPIGWIIGISYGFAGLLMAFWIGAVFGIVSLVFADKKWKTKIAFGPFIIIGTSLAFLYNIDMSSIAYVFGHLIS